MESNPLFVPKDKRIKKPLPPGARVKCRDSEWIVRSCAFDEELNAYAVEVEGTTGYVEGLEATFLDSLDEIKAIDPTEVEIVADDSPKFLKTRLFLDIWLRKAIPTTNALAIGHKAAFHPEQYQHVPAYQALDESRNLRPRILIADAVGLGKTIQVGILLSELVKRGRGKRILVVCLKSMALQFQKEIWSRFAIPLKMLDSKKIEDVFREIPGNMNPLEFYDRAIISMDTLKDKKQLQRLENTHWDVVVIDECHNVARRGSGQGSGRSKLARRLSSICDSLILTSATPHDGSKRSYGSLLELVDPTIVINPEDVTKEDLEKVAVRRFHKDVQLDKKIPKRKEHPRYIPISKKEEEILEKIKHSSFQSFKQTRKDHLIKTTLAKSLYSSPEAFILVLKNRLKKIQSKGLDGSEVESLLEDSSDFVIKDSPKFRELLNILEEIPSEERVVVFTEHKATQTALKEMLSKKLKLKTAKKDEVFEKPAQIVVLHAGLPEKTQQEIVESFASADSKIKLLIATDVASEGINLHYYCNHLVHFDVPWAIITLEQRNGRIDRYGQEKQPNIYYIAGTTKNPDLEKFNEARVVEKLRERLDAVIEQMGEAGMAMGLFDATKEEEKIEERFEKEEDFDDLFLAEFSDLEEFGSIQGISSSDVEYQEQATLLSNSDFISSAMTLVKIKNSKADDGFKIETKSNQDLDRFLKHPFSSLNKELKTDKDFVIDITNSISKMESDIEAARKAAGEWPKSQYLWEINPLFQALIKRVDGTFTSEEVLVANLEPQAPFKELRKYFIFHGSITNRLGQPEISEIIVATTDGKNVELADGFTALKKLGLDTGKIPNSSNGADKSQIKQIQKEIGVIANYYGQKLQVRASKINVEKTESLQAYEKSIQEWKNKKVEFIKKRYKRLRAQKEELHLVDQTVERYSKYIQQKFKIQSEQPYIRPLAVIYSTIEVMNG